MEYLHFGSTGWGDELFFATLMTIGPWLAGTLYDFTTRLFSEIPMMIG